MGARTHPQELPMNFRPNMALVLVAVTVVFFLAMAFNPHPAIPGGAGLLERLRVFARNQEEGFFEPAEGAQPERQEQKPGDAQAPAEDQPPARINPPLLRISVSPRARPLARFTPLPRQPASPAHPAQ